MAHGPTSKDVHDFRPAALKRLARAAEDLRWLLDHDYGMRASLKLVGDHFRLTKRQRQFLYRCVSPPRQAAARRQKLVQIATLQNEKIVLDGYNCLIITECCIAGGIVLLSDDGVLRDIQGLYGAYRLTKNTEHAIDNLVQVLKHHVPAKVCVLLDEKMRYAQRVQQIWQQNVDNARLAATVEFADHADRDLRRAPEEWLVATSDRVNMDASRRVVDLPRAVVDTNDKLAYVDISNMTPPPNSRSRP